MIRMVTVIHRRYVISLVFDVNTELLSFVTSSVQSSKHHTKHVYLYTVVSLHFLSINPRDKP